MKIKINGFILALIVAVITAFFFDQGAEWLRLNVVTDVGIGIIFFFYGLKLSPEAFRAGLTNTRLHVMIQLATFVLFPVIVLSIRPLLVTGPLQELLWVGLFFLAALPSTVSSSVVMVSIARGNIPAAIFNASLSGLIGLIVTPLWLGIVVEEVHNVSFLSIVTKLLLQIVLPLGVGILLHGKMGHWAKKHNKAIAFSDKWVIVLIVYSAFCRSFGNHLLASIAFMDLVKLLFTIWILFLLVMLILLKWSAKWHFNLADRITALFCGSKKSLVHGSVMAKIMFAKSANASLYLLPIMLYHISQIVIISFIADWFAKRDEDPTGEKFPER